MEQSLVWISALIFKALFQMQSKASDTHIWSFWLNVLVKINCFCFDTVICWCECYHFLSFMFRLQCKKLILFDMNKKRMIAVLNNNNPQLTLTQQTLHIIYLFFWFSTGADLVVAQKIQVRFTEPESMFTRRPTSHTCGCVLEVPNNYASYPELAEEFMNVLDANVWVMDIV